MNFVIHSLFLCNLKFLYRIIRERLKYKWRMTDPLEYVPLPRRGPTGAAN